MHDRVRFCGAHAQRLVGATRSNQEPIERAARRIIEIGARKVAWIGLSFKEGTDDLRESPLVARRFTGRTGDSSRSIFRT